MPGPEGLTLSALLANPLTLAGALAALIAACILVMLRRSGGRLALPVAALALAAIALVVFDARFEAADRDAARRALIDRAGALDRAALAPGSPLSCLDGEGGDALENPCEKAIFASPQNASAAVGYMAARLRLLEEGAGFGNDVVVRRALSGIRGAVAQDRFGVAAQALTSREGCSAERCDAFALVDDATLLKGNLRARVFQQYVSRYAASWSAPAAAVPPVAQAVPSNEAGMSLAAVPPGEADKANEKSAKPSSGHNWDFPSAADIPPVSIMSAEPPAKPGDKTADKAADAPAKPAEKQAEKPAEKPATKHAEKPADKSAGAPLQLTQPDASTAR